jgi:hypothetical protein
VWAPTRILLQKGEDLKIQILSKNILQKDEKIAHKLLAINQWGDEVSAFAHLEQIQFWCVLQPSWKLYTP